MKIDNPLALAFMVDYPVEAARVLEQVPVEHAVALISKLPVQTVAPMMGFILPERAAACLVAMTTLSAAKLIAEVSAPAAARIYRHLPSSAQNEISARLPDQARSHIQRHLVYPPESAGALMEVCVDVLPEDVSVGEAIRRLERRRHPVGSEIYIIDHAHRLVGMIDLGKLLASDHHVTLQDVMVRKTLPIFAHAAIETLSSHPGWENRHRLPVIERDNTLLGVLVHNHIKEELGELDGGAGRSSLEDFFTVVNLYWLSMAQLLDSVLAAARQDNKNEC